VPEIALIVLLNFAIGLAAFGALALWWLSTGGQRELASHMANPGAAIELDKALSVGSAVTALFVGGLLAPIIEELVFRGMLYRAWEAQWGWIPAAFASSFVFAFLHPAVYISQFLGGLVFVCIYRRTGSLRAPIVTHAVFNVAVWYPLLGRFVLPAGRETGAIDVWVANFVCLGVVAVALPAYMWIARDDEVRRTRGIAPTEPVLA
jgi:membrane protease YdiL (CAAX protease family)